MRFPLIFILLAATALAGDKPQPTPKPASVLPGCACSTATQLPNSQALLYNCTCPADDGRPLQCVVGLAGVALSVSCSR